MSEEITITIASTNSNSDSLTISATMSTSELCEFATVILNLQATDANQILKDGRVIANSKSINVKTAGIKNGDLIYIVPNVHNHQQPQQQQRPMNTSGGGGLDFSSLLGASNTTPTPPTAAPRSNLTFNIPGLEYAAAKSNEQKAPVDWSGMTLDDALSQNPNPKNLIPVLFSDKHPNLLKELNYHNPSLAKKLRDAGSTEAAIQVYRDEQLKGGMTRAIGAIETETKEQEMTKRLQKDPLDAEANKYFGKKIRKENVEAQYRQMMEEYPESLGRILMLYIEVEVNSHHIQAFVDSGAQSTIMSSSYAERCGLLHLLDTRFSGTAVGVGTGKILGRIHLCPIRIKNHFFPCTITVMEDRKSETIDGVENKNQMDFLFGLDMLKRHKCSIDLAKSALLFRIGNETMETPFLNEHDLDESKGGTKGFDAAASNAEIERMQLEEDEKKKSSS